MDSTPINISNVSGRVEVPTPDRGQVSIIRNLNFSVPSSYTLDFGAIPQRERVGEIRTLFLDNSSNPSEVEISVGGTDQYFTVPAYAEGYFVVTARIGSLIILQSDGGATDTVTAVFYNYDIPPIVWYRYGAANKDIAQRVQGSVPDGDVIADAAFKDPLLIAGKDAAGRARYVSIDDNGAIRIANLDVTIGAIFGPDAVGSAPTHPGVLMAVMDSAGDVKNLVLNANGELIVADAKTVAAIGVIHDDLVAANAKLNALIENTDKATGAARTSIASATGDGSILAANANRQGASVFNDSTAILYLGLGDDPVTAANYSVQVEAGGYYEVPAKFTGAIRGLWAAANGAARVTELI